MSTGGSTTGKVSSNVTRRIESLRVTKMLAATLVDQRRQPSLGSHRPGGPRIDGALDRHDVDIAAGLVKRKLDQEAKDLRGVTSPEFGKVDREGAHARPV